MTTTASAVVVAAMAAAGIALAQPALGQSADQRLGKVHFSTSCKPAAQTQFDRAMLYQHSFWYRASQKAFEEVLKADPDCAIAYWGTALSLLWNPHAAPPAKNLTEGAAALEKGKAMAAKTQREKDYLDALSAMYTDYEKVDHRTRVQNYLKAMEQLAQRYPDDDEAQIHYALALNVGASPADKTYAGQLKGAAILEKIQERQPQHPGVSHYLIHLYDYPAIAEKGLDAARRYAKIAPDAPHAQHMPSHIFTRVGYWKESIASNAEAARVAKVESSGHDQLHAMDYQVYAYLQLGAGQEGQSRHRRDEYGCRLHRDFHSGALCAGYFAGALRGGARRLESRDGAPSPAEPARPCPGDHALCTRSRGGPLRQFGSRQGGHRQARRVAGQAA